MVRVELTAEEKKAKAKAVKAASKEPKKGGNAIHLIGLTLTILVAAANSKEDDVQPAKDEDPDGLKLFSQEKPIEQAFKLLQPLETLQVQDVDVWSTIYDVAMRRRKSQDPFSRNVAAIIVLFAGKYLQALKALNVAKKLSPDHHELHWRVIDFRLQSKLNLDMASLTLSNDPPSLERKSFVLIGRFGQESH